jgi:hypothetical protein
MVLPRQLKDGNGRLCPVQWTGLDRKLGRYQGEISDKDRVKERFWAKLKFAREHGPGAGDWSGMRLVCEHLFTVAARAKGRKMSQDEFLLADY